MSLRFIKKIVITYYVRIESEFDLNLIELKTWNIYLKSVVKAYVKNDTSS